MKLACEKYGVEITIKHRNGENLGEDESFDIFNAKNLPYDEATDFYVVPDLYPYIEKAKSLENSDTEVVIDYAVHIHGGNEVFCYVPNTAGENIRFEGRDYVLAEDLTANAQEDADGACVVAYHAQIEDPSAPERLLEIWYESTTIHFPLNKDCPEEYADTDFDPNSAKIAGIIET